MTLFDDFLDDENVIKEKEPEFPWDKEQAVAAPVEKPADAPAVIVGEDGERESDLDVFSNSKLECFQRCPMKFRLKYIDHHREPKGSALLLGSTIHTAADVAAKNRSNFTTGKLKEFAVAAAANYFNGNLSGTEFEADEDKNEIFHTAQRGVELIVDKYIFSVPIVETEKTWIGDIPGIGRSTGIIDVIEGVVGGGGVILTPCVTDYKTSRSKYEDDAILRSPQLAGYSIMEKIMRVKYVVVLKQKEVKLQILEHIYTEAERLVLFGNMVITWRNIQEAIKSGDESKFPPAIARGFGSPCGKCKLQGICDKTLHDMGKKYFTVARESMELPERISPDEYPLYIKNIDEK